MYILSVFIIFLLHTKSIDDENYNTLKVLEIVEGHSNSQIKSDIAEDMRDFDYKATSISSIANKKMPYINCNRNIFCNKIGFDLNDLLKPENTEFVKNLQSITHDIINRISNIITIINKLADVNYVKPNDGFNDSLKFERKLNNEIEGFIYMLKEQNDILNLKNNAHSFLVEIENYIMLSSGIDLFMLFFKTKPSLLLNDAFDQKYLSIRNISSYILSFNYIYKQTIEHVRELYNIYRGVNNGEYNVLNSSALKSNLLIKWKTDICMKRIIDSSDNFEHCNVTLIYSINTNNDMVKELTNIVKFIYDAKSDNEFELHGLIRATNQKRMHNV